MRNWLRFGKRKRPNWGAGKYGVIGAIVRLGDTWRTHKQKPVQRSWQNRPMVKTSLPQLLEIRAY